MTEVGSSSGGAQVLNLRQTTTRAPGSDSVERVPTEVAPPPEPQAPVTGFSGNTIDKLAEETERDPLEQAAEAIEEFIPEFEQVPNTRLRIDKDDETGRFVYYSVDDESGEVLRQFPPENILKFLSYYRGLEEGLVVDDTI